jgi:lipoyl(octanoyl) transferase
VRTLEEALIRCCAEVGVATTRVPGRSGVWITGDGRPDRKVAAVGIRVSRGVTMHGFALNCDCDLGWFDKIVPCGIKDAGVTSLSAEAGRAVTVAELTGLAEHHLADVFGAVAWRRADVASLLPAGTLTTAGP